MSDPCASEYNPTMYRWQVIDAYDKATGNLAKCLAVAGALCAAFRLGQVMPLYPSRHELASFWYSGCGREVPR